MDRNKLVHSWPDWSLGWLGYQRLCGWRDNLIDILEAGDTH